MEGAPASREQRKTVTVLFCDVTGSTALGESTDPEALRALLARYFERMKGIVESHGGTVEKFIGDAVMAVFGVPQVHEDDALRACRAAVEMRDALPELGLQARIGVNTGEVVTGTEERLATGDAVNVAARLEQAAQPGEILIGEDDARARPRRGRDRSRRAARAEGQGGAGSGLPARRGPRGAGAPPRDAVRRPASELRALRRAWQRVLDERRVRARDRPRRCRRRQVAARGRVPRLGRGAGRPRPLPLLRRGDHILAGGGGAEAARRAALRSGRSGLAPLAASARRSEGTRPRRSPGRSASCSRSRRRSSACSTTSSGARRRSSIWSSTSPLSRATRRSCCSAWRGPSCASAGPAVAELDPPARAAPREETSTRCSRSGVAAELRERSPMRPAETRCSSTEMLAIAARPRRRGRRPAHPPGAARRRLDQLERRSGACSSVARSRASLPPRRRPGARSRGARR